MLKDNIQQRIITTSYASGYIYEDTNGTEVLQLLPHPEGYVAPITIKGVASYQYAFNYTDHLGNVRLTYSDSNNDGAIDPTTEIISEKHYYPFGLQQRGYNDAVTSNKNDVAERFMFEGVELEESLGLNLYEMDWRNYDASIGRFNSIDSHSETYYEWSPYHFAGNNPIFITDPDGQDWVINMSTDDDGNVTYDITLNIAVLNSSGDDFNMDEVVSTVTKQLNNAFNISEENEDGTTTTVNFTANVRSVDSIDELGQVEHLLEIGGKEEMKGRAGFSETGGLWSFISPDIIKSAINGDNVRSIAHEVAHTGKLYHPNGETNTFLGIYISGTPENQKMNNGDDDDNFMYQASYAKRNFKRGTNLPVSINANQAYNLYDNYKRGKLNNQNIYYTFPYGFGGRFRKKLGK